MFKMLSDLLFVPFEFGKTDCWWLTREVHKRYGIIIPEHNVAKNAVLACMGNNTDKEIAKQIDYCQKHLSSWNKIDTPKTPCVVLFAVNFSGYYAHFGTYIGNDYFIHSSVMRKYPTIEKLSNPFYAKHKYYKFDPHNNDSKSI